MDQSETAVLHCTVCVNLNPVLIFLTVALVLLNDLKLSPVSSTNADWFLTQVGPQGNFLVASLHSVFNWNPDGTLHLTFKPQGNILGLYYDSDLYYVSESNPSVVTNVYDSSGSLVAQTKDIESFIFKYIPVNGALYISPYGNNDYLTKEPYFYLVYEPNINILNGVLKLAPSPLFGKITQKQVDQSYTSLSLWVDRHGDVFYLVNELESVVYIYDKESIKDERRDGTKFPTQTRFTKLELVKFVEAPDEFFSIKVPTPKSQFNSLRQKWRNSWSRITWFGKLGDGYVISYEIPDCGEQVPGDCLSTHLGIQRLNSDFKNEGELVETQGLMMGVNPSGQICVFQSHPIIENGVTVGNQPTVVFF